MDTRASALSVLNFARCCSHVKRWLHRDLAQLGTGQLGDSKEPGTLLLDPVYPFMSLLRFKR